MSDLMCASVPDRLGRHPLWCGPQHCSVAQPTARAHLSRPAVARSNRTGMAVSVQLVQSVGNDEGCFGGPTLVSVLVGFPDDGPGSPAREYPLCFDVEHAQTVGWILYNLGRWARQDDRRY
jgi:hypothetical protein